MRKLPFNDEWIITNSHRFKSFRELAEEHNKLFGTAFSRRQMKNHAGLGLGVRMNRYWYTPEMEEWIRREFPKVGTAEEKTAEFNRVFGTDRKPHSLNTKAKLMGVKLSDEALSEYKRKSAERIANYSSTVKAKPIGYVGRYCNGYPMIKVGKGEWAMQSRYVYESEHGKVKDGHVVIYLDGDKHNASADNLMAIPLKCQAVMTAKKFWSEEPNLTKTGAIWSELYLILQDVKGAEEA